MRLLAYCVMPNHWHLVLWPREDPDLSEYMRLLTAMHTQRWHAEHHTTGSGPLYQGRFKSFPIQADDHFLTVCRYVERNPLRANLVTRAEEWRWSSLWRRMNRPPGGPDLHNWPLAIPENWLERINRPETERELAALHSSVSKGAPFGEGEWQQQTADQQRLNATLRKPGRPSRINTTDR